MAMLNWLGWADGSWEGWVSTAGGGSTVAFNASPGKSSVGGAGVVTLSHKLTDLGDGTYNVETLGGVNFDDLDAPVDVEYTIG